MTTPDIAAEAEALAGPHDEECARIDGDSGVSCPRKGRVAAIAAILARLKADAEEIERLRGLAALVSCMTAAAGGGKSGPPEVWAAQQVLDILALRGRAEAAEEFAAQERQVADAQIERAEAAEAQVSYEQERNANNVASYAARVAELEKELRNARG